MVRLMVRMTLRMDMVVIMVVIVTVTVTVMGSVAVREPVRRRRKVLVRAGLQVRDHHVSIRRTSARCAHINSNQFQGLNPNLVALLPI
jgi:hypothetical protein